MAQAQEPSCAISLPGKIINWRQDELRASPESPAAESRGLSFKIDLMGSMRASYEARSLRSLYKIESAQGALIAYGQYGRDRADEFVRVFDCSGKLLGTWREVFVGDSLRWLVEVVLEDPDSRIIAKSGIFRHLAGSFWVTDVSTGLAWLSTDQLFSSAPELTLQSLSGIDSRLAPFVLLFRSTPKNNHL